MSNSPRSLGNYILEHELGRGATSQVWQGRHRFLRERVVAVKILLSQDEESVERFSREADLTSRLHHPNIVAVYDHGKAGSFLYTIMQLVPGGSLRQYLEKHGRVEIKDAVNVFRQIGAALDFAHSNKIIHRDVSPGNILLEAGPIGHALLTDFGIARLPQQSHTTTHVIMGTPGFFSPEHAQSATAVTAQSDLYGLGVILYHMITGALPWDKTPEHPDYRFGPVIGLAAHGIDLPPDVDRVFQTLLAVDPKKRYATAAEAGKALDRALARAGITLSKERPATADGPAPRAINTAENYQSDGVLESEVEQVLGADLRREPIEKAHERAEQLRDPLAVGQLLDAWSAAGSFWEFRRQNLGRIVNLRDVRSRNIYFYELDALLETRESPATVEEPDQEAQPFPVRREIERWQVKLPPPTGFTDDPGRSEIIAGSERVIQCPRCEGNGHELCPQCKGARRIMQTRAVAGSGDAGGIHHQETVVLARGQGGAAIAEQPAVAPQVAVKQTLVACPICGGAGALACPQCEGSTRLVQRKAFNWRRAAAHRASRDDIPDLDEDALRKEVAEIEVYRERTAGFKREWTMIPGLRTLIANVERQIGPDTRVVLAEATIKMIPVTVVQLDIGRQDVTVEGDETPKRASDDEMHSVQIAGFENHLHVGKFAIDTGRQFLVFAVAFLVIMVVILLGYVFIFR